MSKHTPGPWHAYSAKADEEEQVWWVDGDEGEPICDLYRTLNGMETIPKANGFANARLISAAPDMAEALKLCVTVIENGADDLGAKQAARAALKKAGV